MRRKLPPGTKQRALELLASGMDPREVALKCDISESTAKNWKADLGKSASPVPSAEQGSSLFQTPATPGFPAPAADIGTGPIQERAGEDLSSLLAKHPGTGFAGGPSASLPISPAPPAPKPMDPEALLACVKVIKTIVVQTASSAWKVPLTEEEVKNLTEFSEPEQKSLKMLAPYAAEYSGAMEQYAKPALAFAFVGVAAFSTVHALAVIKSKRPPKPMNVMKKGAKK